ncbi:hypothetical protein ASR47_1005361 [Janthinobacterium psychrotolerans]|uniref:Uncharacterized protein n=1 Tax=Janthinobacterium psychrotolerans TaxID=1747903 RepID=A0A1A7C267_9BURK|nr:hypothetical protein ASR47_1005361 [Janthinobacterium psychrotolerans]
MGGHVQTEWLVTMPESLVTFVRNTHLEGRIGCALAYLDVQTPGLWDMPFLLV